MLSDPKRRFGLLRPTTSHGWLAGLALFAMPNGPLANANACHAGAVHQAGG
jgi:hypothetical protein